MATAVQEWIRPEARAEVDHSRPHVVGHAHADEKRIRTLPHAAREHMRPEQKRVHQSDRQDSWMLRVQCTLWMHSWPWTGAEEGVEKATTVEYTLIESISSDHWTWFNNRTNYQLYQLLDKKIRMVVNIFCRPVKIHLVRIN